MINKAGSLDTHPSTTPDDVRNNDELFGLRGEIPETCLRLPLGHRFLRLHTLAWLMSGS